jgi:hypothetical protein
MELYVSSVSTVLCRDTNILEMRLQCSPAHYSPVMLTIDTLPWALDTLLLTLNTLLSTLNTLLWVHCKPSPFGKQFCVANTAIFTSYITF